MLEIIQPGLQASIQDSGRPHCASLGMRRCGALDPWAMQAANTLLGNASNAPVLEFAGARFEFKALSATQVVVAGHYLSIDIAGHPVRPLAGWQVLSLEAGQHLVIHSREWSCRNYLAARGGLIGEKVLGSHATDDLAVLGGHQGRWLQAGDRLHTGDETTTSKVASPLVQAVPLAPGNQLRALPGPELEQLPRAMVDAFWRSAWQVSPDSNRMGCRLLPAGNGNRQAAIAHDQSLRSHAVLPGTVQIPQGGQPVVLLADAQTTGGYPRIAKVIDADLWQFAHLPVGSTIRFSPVTREQALAALAERQQHLYKLALSVQQLSK